MAAKKKIAKKKLWNVYGAVHASTYVGEFEAESAEKAIEKAEKVASVSVCHQCSNDISDPEVVEFFAELIDRDCDE